MSLSADTDITEHTPRPARLDALETQVVDARDTLIAASRCGDLGLALDAVEQVATLLQHTLQELKNLAEETSPR